MTSHKISAAQFYVAMFVSRVVVTIALNARYTGGEHMLDNIVSYFLAMLLGLAIAIPVWLCQHGNLLSVPHKAVGALGPAGSLVPLIYCIYFILVGGSSLAIFQLFLMDTVDPGFSAGWVIAALVGVALYGALRGLETAARCATCVFVVLALGCGLVFAFVSGRFRGENLEPLFYDGPSQLWQGMILFIARTSIFADMAVLLPQVKGHKKSGFLGWALGTSLFVGLLILLIVGCLGPYAYTQSFPVYALASITEVRSMQRLDAVFIGVWMMGLIIKLSFDLYACRVCASAIAGRHEGPSWAVWLAGALMLALALFTAGSQGLQAFVLNTSILFWCTIITGGALPLLVWVIGLIRPRKAKGGQGNG